MPLWNADLILYFQPVNQRKLAVLLYINLKVFTAKSVAVRQYLREACSTGVQKEINLYGCMYVRIYLCTGFCTDLQKTFKLYISMYGFMKSFHFVREYFFTPVHKVFYLSLFNQ